MTALAAWRRWRRGNESDLDHPAPVEFDLGLRMSWEVDAVVAGLVAEGNQLHLVRQAQPTLATVAATGGRSHYTVLVAAEDVADVRAALEEAGLL